MTMTTTEITSHIVEHSAANGGGTFAPADAARPVSGYAVTVAVLDSLAGKGLFLPEVEPYLHFIAPGNFLGTWYDRENDCWEISQTAVFEDREQALEIAAVLGERYVYDLAADEEVAVPAPARADG